MYDNHNNNVIIVFFIVVVYILINAKRQKISVGQPNYIKDNKINIDIFVHVNLSPLTYLVQEFLLHTSL